MTSLAKNVRSGMVPSLLGIWAAAVAMTPGLQGRLLLTIPVAIAFAILCTVLRPGIWLYLFAFCLLALPPVPMGDGSSTFHVAPLAALLGVLACLLRRSDWRRCGGKLPAAFVGMVAVLLISVGLAALYSGPEIALGSVIRVFLFASGVFVFFYAFAAPESDGPNAFQFTRFLFYLGTAAALFACFDFYFQLPAPAGFGPQFVWLDQGVFRRAQGLFYEASTLGNFCAFFVVFVMVSLFRPKRESPLSRIVLVTGGCVFFAALILSYSRASILNVAVAACALLFVRKAGTGRPLLTLGGLTVAAAVAVRVVSPSFSANYWSRIANSILYAAASPDGVLSGRLTSWSVLADFLSRSPWHAILGIGYKTLPYSDFTGTKVIADNTYLGLLVETGVFGLAALLILNGLILVTGFRAARSARPKTALFGQWIFCFWAGETVQMFSGDLITYWRVLPLYFWVLGIAARELREP